MMRRVYTHWPYECLGPVMDPQCGCWECPDGSHEPDQADCDKCRDDFNEEDEDR